MRSLLLGYGCCFMLAFTWACRPILTGVSTSSQSYVSKSGLQSQTTPTKCTSCCVGIRHNNILTNVSSIFDYEWFPGLNWQTHPVGLFASHARTRAISCKKKAEGARPATFDTARGCQGSTSDIDTDRHQNPRSPAPLSNTGSWPHSHLVSPAISAVAGGRGSACVTRTQSAEIGTVSDCAPLGRSSARPAVAQLASTMARPSSVCD